MKVLVTGASGSLGTRLVPALTASGHAVRALSRSQRTASDVEWVGGDLRTGEGIDAAVSGVEVVLHAATDGGFEGGKVRMRKAFFHSPRTDVGGTATLLRAAKEAGTPHIIYTSIVGTDRMPTSYYKHKAQAEELVRAGGIPYTIARITQFHSLLGGLIRYASRFPIAALPLRTLYQPIDERDAAVLVAGVVGRAPSDGFVEFGGPERHTLAELVEEWKRARGVTKRFRNMPAPGNKPAEEGVLCTEDRSGTITWERWLKEVGA